MNVLIIEDELPAGEKLEAMLKLADPSVCVVAKIRTVKATVEWLRKNNEPDIAFVDVQLADDQSFEIFRRHPVQCPVVFVTAYDKYLLESFEYNSIDYLLKPVTQDRLQLALEKIKRLQRHFQGNLQGLVSGDATNRQHRIVARKGMEYVAVEKSDIAYLYTQHKVIFLRDFSNRLLLLDKNLTEWEAILGPTDFFRLNRKFIASRKSIDRFRPDQGKIRVILSPPTTEEVHVSKEGAAEFRKWIGLV